MSSETLLHELAESWQEEYDHPTPDRQRNARALAKRECACELLEVLDGE